MRKRIGYWKESIFDPLPEPQRMVVHGWDPAERTKVADYLRTKGDPCDASYGYAHCRFECGITDEEMGCRDLSDGIYVWPEGFAHYVEKHNVQPPDEFIAYVLRGGSATSTRQRASTRLKP
jgi:hypothetical protein